MERHHIGLVKLGKSPHESIEEEEHKLHEEYEKSVKNKYHLPHDIFEHKKRK